MTGFYWKIAGRNQELNTNVVKLKKMSFVFIKHTMGKATIPISWTKVIRPLMKLKLRRIIFLRAGPMAILLPNFSRFQPPSYEALAVRTSTTQILLDTLDVTYFFVRELQ